MKAVLLIMVLVAILGGVGYYMFMPSKKMKRIRFINTGPILSGKQNEIYASIEETLGEEYKVFPKVPVHELIGIDPRIPEKERQTATNEFSHRNIDFCVVKADTMETICCIMVPRTLQVDQAVIADKALKAALTQAKIPLVYIKPSADLSPQSIYKRLKHAIEKDHLPQEEHDRHKSQANSPHPHYGTALDTEND